MTKFKELEIEYHLKETSDERKKELISDMQADLHQRCKENTFITCLDKKQHSIDSNNFEDLRAIDAALNSNKVISKMESTAASMREEAKKINKYSKDNPYPLK